LGVTADARQAGPDPTGRPLEPGRDLADAFARDPQPFQLGIQLRGPRLPLPGRPVPWSSAAWLAHGSVMAQRLRQHAAKRGSGTLRQFSSRRDAGPLRSETVGPSTYRVRIITTGTGGTMKEHDFWQLIKQADLERRRQAENRAELRRRRKLTDARETLRPDW